MICVRCKKDKNESEFKGVRKPIVKECLSCRAICKKTQKTRTARWLANGGVQKYKFRVDTRTYADRKAYNVAYNKRRREARKAKREAKKLIDLPDNENREGRG
jgi:hypothetical protein